MVNHNKTRTELRNKQNAKPRPHLLPCLEISRIIHIQFPVQILINTKSFEPRLELFFPSCIVWNWKCIISVYNENIFNKSFSFKGFRNNFLFRNWNSRTRLSCKSQTLNNSFINFISIQIKEHKIVFRCNNLRFICLHIWEIT